jgi:DMSO reductase family type II enzyme chaperone
MAEHAPASRAIADLFAVAAEALSYPGDTLATVVADGSLDAAVTHLLEHAGFDADWQGTLHHPGTTGKELEAEYIRLFDAPDGRPCPLYTGVYARRRRDAMEELLRFYRHFGLTVSPGAHDLPDSVPTVLEFLQFLCLRDAAGEGQAGLHSVGADVIDRHLLPWARETTRRIDERRPHPFYRAAIGLVETVAGALAQAGPIPTSVSRGH